MPRNMSCCLWVHSTCHPIKWRHRAGVVLPWKGMAETLRRALAKSTMPTDNLRCYFSQWE